MSRVRAPSVTPSENGLTTGQAVFLFCLPVRAEEGRMPQGTLTDTREAPAVDGAEQALPDTPWVTIVWNDPVNLMTYVSWVFRSYFGYSAPEAERLMLLVHTEGRAVVASGGREEMERHVEAMHDFGLWATLTRDDA